MDESTISNASAILTGALTTAVSFGVGVDPHAGVFISANSPIIHQLIYRGIHFLFGRTPTQMECARLGIAYNEAANTIKSNILAGKKERNDGFFEESYNGNYSKANEIIEAALRYTTEDPETIKSICYGRFIGNIPYCNLSQLELVALSKTIRDLTVAELCIIAVLHNKGVCNFFSLENVVRSNCATEEMVFYSSILHLKTLGVLVPTGQFFSASFIGFVFLSKAGNELYDLMELNRLEVKEVQKYESLYHRFAKTSL